MDVTQPTAAELVEAINAAFLSDYLALYFDKREELEVARTAFATYRQRCEALEAFAERVANSAEGMQEEMTQAEQSNHIEDSRYVQYEYQNTLTELGKEARELLK